MILFYFCMLPVVIAGFCSGYPLYIFGMLLVRKLDKKEFLQLYLRIL